VQDIPLFLNTPKPAQRPTHSPIQWVPVFFLGCKAAVVSS